MGRVNKPIRQPVEPVESIDDGVPTTTYGQRAAGMLPKPASEERVIDGRCAQERVSHAPGRGGVPTKSDRDPIVGLGDVVKLSLEGNELGERESSSLRQSDAQPAAGDVERRGSPVKHRPELHSIRLGLLHAEAAAVMGVGGEDRA